MKEILNTPFNHSEWFKGSGITKKLALQYFVSTGDFNYNGKRLRYTGKECGTYQLSKSECLYYEQLIARKEVVQANAEKKYDEISKGEKLKKKIYYIDGDCLVTLWEGCRWNTVSFIEYLEFFCKNFCEEINLEKLKLCSE
jgi:hypothetical protein